LGLTYAFEPLLDLLVNDRLGEKIKAHWTEIATDKTTVPLSVNWGAYLQREQAGSFRAFIARRDDVLVGYIGVNFFRPDRHTGTLYVRDETIWVVPDEGPGRRGLVWAGMWKALLPVLPRPCKVMAGLTLSADPRQAEVLGGLLRRLGLRPMEMVMGAYLE
jgi:hypothetical protein